LRAAAAAREAQNAIPPAEFFKTTKGSDFSQYDEEVRDAREVQAVRVRSMFTRPCVGCLCLCLVCAQGVPTHDAKGEPISKKKLKKLKKLLLTHTKKHNKWLESQQ